MAKMVSNTRLQEILDGNFSFLNKAEIDALVKEVQSGRRYIRVVRKHVPAMATALRRIRKLGYNSLDTDALASLLGITQVAEQALTDAAIGLPKHLTKGGV